MFNTSILQFKLKSKVLNDTYYFNRLQKHTALKALTNPFKSQNLLLKMVTSLNNHALNLGCMLLLPDLLPA